MKKQELFERIQSLSYRLSDLEADNSRLRNRVLHLEKGVVDQPLLTLMTDALHDKPLPPPPNDEMPREL